MSTEPTYRIYRYDGGKIVAADWLHADNDDEAVAKAQADGALANAEIWEGSRMVAQLGGERQAL